jgi:hypothetical protein
MRLRAKWKVRLSLRRSARMTTRTSAKAQTEVCEDLVASGVIDPAKVTRSALQNSTLIAGLILTTEAMVGEIPEQNRAPAPGGSRRYCKTEKAAVPARVAWHVPHLDHVKSGYARLIPALVSVLLMMLYAFRESFAEHWPHRPVEEPWRCRLRKLPNRRSRATLRGHDHGGDGPRRVLSRDPAKWEAVRSLTPSRSRRRVD